MSNVFTRGLSRISTRKKKTRALPVVPEAAEVATEVVDHNEHVKPSLLGRGMDRIRRSIRQSFRRKRSPERLPPAELVSNTSSGSKHDQWQPDEGAVRAGLCSFNVKYLGSVEVFEARGMQVCEGALKMLRNSRRRPVKSVLYVSGDGLRVVDQQSNRGLIVDQTIEKVSFCAPDRNNDKGFAYICRDGTSRRWMCHGFSASKDSGERLSHAVGCAFAICLERKKKRDDDSTPVVTAEKALHPDWGETAAGGSTGTATASSSEDSGVGVHRANPAYQSFRKQISISDRLQDPQSAIVNVVPQRATSGDPSIAKPRPAPNPALFQRQGSLRAPETSTSSAQFRRNLSLRSTSVDAKPNRVPLGQLMHNEPIYEGDEELTDVGSFLPATSSVTAPPTMAHLARTDNSMYPSVSPQMDLSLFGSPASTSTSHNVTSNTSSSNSMVGGSHWSTFDSSGGASAIGAQSKTNNQWSSANNGAMTSSTSRNKADEWLEDAMRTSVSFNSPLQTAQVTPTATPQGNGWSTSAPEPAKPAVSSHYSLLDGPLVSGPPPSHPPPPLPAKAAVSNGKQYSSPSPSSPSVDVFGQAIQWDAPPPTIPKPIDPFDVQWSRLAISANNPFSSEHSSGREVSI